MCMKNPKITRQEKIKTVFEEYGIIYNPETEKIYSPINGGMWINLLLVDGNAKIGKGIYHFSTLPTNKHFHLNIALTKKETVIKSKKSKKIGQTTTVVALDDEKPVFVDVDGTCPCTCDGCYADTKSLFPGGKKKSASTTTETRKAGSFRTAIPKRQQMNLNFSRTEKRCKHG